MSNANWRSTLARLKYFGPTNYPKSMKSTGSTSVLFALLMTLALIVGGCGRGAAKGKVDMGPLIVSFSSADAAAKSVVDKAVAAVKAEDYEAAERLLQSLKKKPLNQEQRAAVGSVLAALPAHPRIQP
jgi:hypothetical protein